MNERKLSDFSSPEKLIAWCYNNIKEIPQEEDNEFIFPPEIFEKKMGCCIDIAFLMHLYCDMNNIQNTICSIDIDYKSTKYSKENNGIGHVICTYYMKNKWIIAQTDGINDKNTNLHSCIFIGNNDIHYTVLSFGKKLLNGMIPWLKNWKPNCIITKLYYTIFTLLQLKRLDIRCETNNTKNKQKFFRLLLTF